MKKGGERNIDLIREKGKENKVGIPTAGILLSGLSLHHSFVECVAPLAIRLIFILICSQQMFPHQHSCQLTRFRSSVSVGGRGLFLGLIVKPSEENRDYWK